MDKKKEAGVRVVKNSSGNDTTDDFMNYINVSEYEEETREMVLSMGNFLQPNSSIDLPCLSLCLV
jgi:hypothetical protein